MHVRTDPTRENLMLPFNYPWVDVLETIGKSELTDLAPRMRMQAFRAYGRAEVERVAPPMVGCVRSTEPLWRYPATMFFISQITMTLFQSTVKPAASSSRASANFQPPPSSIFSHTTPAKSVGISRSPLAKAHTR